MIGLPADEHKTTRHSCVFILQTFTSYTGLSKVSNAEQVVGGGGGGTGVYM